jgi:ketosteroid isomerase-like protein
MFCPSCGNQVPDDSVFCPACGTDLNAARQTTQAIPPAAPLPVPQPAQPLQPPQPYAQPTQQMPAQPYPPRPGQPLPPGAAPGGPGGYQPAPGAPGAHPPAPAKSKAGLIIGIVIGALVLFMIVVAFGGFVAWRAYTSATRSPLSVTTAPSTSASGGSAKGVSTPEAAVDAWFAAVAKGDLAAVKSAATPEFASAIDAGMFEGRDPNTGYTMSPAQVSGDQATIDVLESPSNAPAKTTTTLTLAKQPDGTWLVAGYVVTATGATVGSTSGTGAETAAPGTSSAATFDADAAMYVVDKFLADLKDGDGSVASTLATPRFKSANKGWIYGPLTGFNFEVTNATKQGDAWVVNTKEQWVSGDENGTYTVVVVNGKGLVDRRDGLQ